MNKNKEERELQETDRNYRGKKGFRDKIKETKQIILNRITTPNKALGEMNTIRMIVCTIVVILKK
jgi:hypothetical protein